MLTMLPEEKLSDAIIALEDLMEFNKETEEALEDALNCKNLIGPFNNAREMMQAVLAGNLNFLFEAMKRIKNLR